jgi:hypothetical protein
LPLEITKIMCESSLSLHGGATKRKLYIPPTAAAFASRSRSALAGLVAVDEAVAVDAAAAVLDALVVVLVVSPNKLHYSFIGNIPNVLAVLRLTSAEARDQRRVCGDKIDGELTKSGTKVTIIKRLVSSSLDW